MASKRKTVNHLTFMTESTDGKYGADKPADDQLAAVLPWLLNGFVTYGQAAGYARSVNDLVPQVLRHLGIVEDPYGITLRDAAGFDAYGYDKDNYNRNGYNRNGYNRQGRDRRGFDEQGYGADGYNLDGYDRDGFDRKGNDYYGRERTAIVKQTVEGWDPGYAALIAKLIAEKDQAEADTEIADAVQV